MPKKSKAKPKAPKKDDRNRAALALKAGRYMRAFELSGRAVRLISAAVAFISDTTPQKVCSRTQALEWLIDGGAEKLPEKYLTGIDAD